MLFLDNVIAVEKVISFVYEIELQSWLPDNPNDLKIYILFVSQSTVIGIDNEIIKETIKIRQFFRLKLPDAIIVATAIINNLTLVADNDKDFMRIPGIKYLNPRVTH